MPATKHDHRESSTEMAKTKFIPSEAKKKAAFRNSMFYEIVFTFGVPAHDPLDYSHWEMINFTRMAHARLLYDFLEKNDEQRYKDDVLAVDYGYPAQTIELSEDDRARLNKDLFHLSYDRLRHSPETKPWPNSILSNLLAPVLGFMKHIRDARADMFETEDERVAWSYLICLLESGRELRIKVLADVDNRPRYTFDLGPPLPSGKPVLTRFVTTSMLPFAI
jgi:hypothetical protein